MRRPLHRSRFIAQVAALAALAALDFGAAVAWLDHRTPTNDLLLVGALPMANILVIGMLIGLQRPEGHPFLRGFVAFGATALACFVLVAASFPEALWANAEPLINRVRWGYGQYGPLACILIILSVATTILTLPQVVLAVTGGLLCRRFRRTITPD